MIQIEAEYEIGCGKHLKIKADGVMAKRLPCEWATPKSRP